MSSIVIGPLCFLVVKILVFIYKFAPLCSVWPLVVEILVFLNKFAPLCSFRPLSLPDVSRILIIKLRPTNIISKITFCFSGVGTSANQYAISLNVQY